MGALTPPSIRETILLKTNTPCCMGKFRNYEKAEKNNKILYLLVGGGGGGTVIKSSSYFSFSWNI